VCVVDATVHRPSLDDVFLSLTGTAASESATRESETGDVEEEILS
jgi:ABC-2 type transport system ATP-binding protein